ncbi:MAG: Stp1/IreP family PP2C-type Ser/Thr phosphatase [Lachnospiraceae bacterium]|nr:Stp1/IreP family PP2C-type Ser/Thr phosphatase [Lachnospiraceae bacterium]
MESFGRTDVGIVRSVNQDYIYTSNAPVGPLPNLYIVADGMGGHNAGDYASKYTVENFISKMNEARKDTTYSVIKLVEDTLREINEELIVQAAENPDLEGMGTTFVMCTVGDDGDMYVCNIGDSRLYIIDNDIRQITEDHSLVAEMVRKGEIEKDEARFHPKKNVVTRALSAMGMVTPDFFNLKLDPGAVVLLCSDGLSNMIGDAEIFSIVNEYRDDLTTTAQILVDKANDNGGKDNISVVLLRRDAHEANDEAKTS